MADKHTPGPWKVVGEQDGYYSNIQVLANDGAFITRVNSSNHPNKANAHLIAASPELLEAANEVEAAIQGLALDAALKAATDKLYAAIRKAEGK